MMSSNHSFSLLIIFSLFLLLILDSTNLTVAKSCLRKCGGIKIPYPFGIGKGCYLEKWYEINCTSVSGKLVPLLSIFRKEVVNISLPESYANARYEKTPQGSIRIKNRITSKGCSIDGEEELGSVLNLTGTPFYVSSRNTLIASGCNNTASLTNVEPSMVGCRSSCVQEDHTPTKYYLALVRCYENGNNYGTCKESSIYAKTECNGIGCCQTNTRFGTQQIVGVKIDESNTTRGGCKVAFLTDETYSLSNASDPQRLHAERYATVDLGWFIDTTNLSYIGSLGCNNMEIDFNYTSSCLCDYNSNSSYASCRCNGGYKGNPYFPGGCTDINECLEQFTCLGGGTCVNSPGNFRCVYTYPTYPTTYPTNHHRDAACLAFLLTFSIFYFF